MIQVSYEQLATLFPRANDEILTAVAAGADSTLAQFGINETLDRLTFFLAQIGHESAGLTEVEENFNYTSAARIYRFYRGKGRFTSVAEAASFVRNPDALRSRLYGEAPSYYGRGLIQLTNRDNYAAVGAIVGLDLVGSPELAARPENLLLIACGYWQMRDINACADRGDYDAASRRINPHEPDLPARRVYLAAARRVFSGQPGGVDALFPRPITNPLTGDAGMIALGASGALVKNLQQTLEGLNYPVGKTDGIFGKLTRAAVVAFQIDHDLPTTGEADAATMAALSDASPRSFEPARANATARDVRAQGSRTVANADYVRIAGLITTILGALGIVTPAASTTGAPASAAATNASDQLLNALTALEVSARQFPQTFDRVGPQAITALKHWVAAVGAVPGADGTVPAGSCGQDALCNIGHVLLPVVTSLVPGGLPGSLIVAALGIGAQIFGNNIVKARVEDFRTGKNLGR